MGAFATTAVASLLRLCVLIFVVLFLLDTLGRRPLMLCSLAGTGTCLVSLAFCYHWDVSVSWKITAFMIYGCSFSFGMGPVPFVYCTEVFASSVRGKSVSFGMFMARVLSGVITLTFPIATDKFGIVPCFMTLACLNFSALVYLYILAPETAGTSLEEMHSVFKAHHPVVHDEEDS